MPLSTLLTTQSDPSRVAALRALLRDNTGAVSCLAKVDAFKALPSASRTLDIKV